MSSDLPEIDKSQLTEAEKTVWDPSDFWVYAP